jgi:hypothetical protein
LAQHRYVDAATQARRALGLHAPSDDQGEGVAEIALVLQRARLAEGSAPAQPPAQAWAPLLDAPVYPVQALLAAEWAAARGDDATASRGFRRALDLAERRGVPADVAWVTTSYGAWLLDRGRAREAGEIIGRVSPWANRDFDCALLEARLFHALGQPDAWSSALARATALAGERAIPADLRDPPH